MADDLSDTIRTAAANPQRVALDGVVVEQQKLTDLIAADEHLAKKTAATKNHLGCFFRKLVSSD
jgi:hypothetical protein